MVTIKNQEEIRILKKGGKILARVLTELSAMVKPGISTEELETKACDMIAKAGGRPSFKNYKTRHDLKPFPTALCTSVNDQIVHCPSVPGRTLKDGDIISIDIGMEYPFTPGKQGLFTDTAITVPVGNVADEIMRLVNVTKESLYLGIAQVKPGKTLNDIGKTIQAYVESNGFSVVRDLVGHGVGYAVHEDPQVPNYIMKGAGFNNIKLKPGMVLALEPMVNVGSYEVRSDEDNFTIATLDGSLSAHFEHTVAITAKGNIIITQ